MDYKPMNAHDKSRAKVLLENQKLVSEKDALAARLAECEAANANCISLSLHESRIREVEVRLAECEANSLGQLQLISGMDEMMDGLREKLAAAEAEKDLWKDKHKIVTEGFEKLDEECQRLGEQNAELLAQVELWKGRCDKNGDRLANCDDERIEALAWCERLAGALKWTVQSMNPPFEWRPFVKANEALAEFEAWRKEKG